MTAHQHLYKILLCVVFTLSLIEGITSQEIIETRFDPIVESIKDLESQKDPKCHTTANRLEDFMYGTPLSFEARELRIQLQKKLVRAIWQRASQDSQSETLSLDEINKASVNYIKTIVSEGQIYLQTNDNRYIPISSRDLRQYSSIAYSLRAILSVQQDDLLGIVESDLKRLSETCITQLKAIIDLASLAALHIADNEARRNNRYTVDTNDLSNAWSQIVHEDLYHIADTPMIVQDNAAAKINQVLLKKTIDQKLDSYQEYNQLSQKLFLRNIQVYFAKKKWPKSEIEAKLLTESYQEALIQYSAELFAFSQVIASREDEKIIRLRHINTAIQAFLPYRINEFEDVTYFPLLEANERVTIESYDLDAFRDSGLHWQIVKFMLEDPNLQLTHDIDPFASELLVEGIAQFGVLLWRVAGSLTTHLEQERLSNASLLEAMDKIRSLTQKNNGRHGIEDREKQLIVSNDQISEALTNEFIDVTDSLGVTFVHRSADWLQRQLRSYIYKPDENLARLSIPPAFGGGGVAAEDINQDGYDDLLLLGGYGNKLFLNDTGKGFVDATSASGLSSVQLDGTFQEPRQPIICDFNNDGHQDIFISYVDAQHQIYEGRGDGTFIDRSNTAQLGGQGLVGGPATVADYNSDGLLDIYIGYFGNYIQGELPTLARSNTNGTPNALYYNKGDFLFEIATEAAGIANVGWTQAVGHTDINKDGHQDIIVGNDFGTNAYYINVGDGTFMDKSKGFGTDKPSYTMNVGIADLNRDQYPDFYISNIVVMEKDDKYVLPSERTTMHFDPSSLATMRISEANDLFISNSDQEDVIYESSISIDRGYAHTGWSWDADFFDYDNDGDEDLYVLNGMNPYSVYGQENDYYQSPTGVNSNVLFAQSKEEKNVFFKNEDGRLNQYSKESGLDLLHTSRSAVYTDYDLDGDLDVVINNYHGRAYVYENQSHRRKHNWIKIRLIADSQGTNHDAIGAKVIVNSKNHKNIWREVHSTDGYLSSHPKTQHFGLGKDKECSVIVIWPDGKTDSFDISELNRTYSILQKSGERTIIF